MTTSPRRSARIWSLCLALACPGCGTEIDTRRNPAPRGTFGEEVHRILKKDLDRSQPAKGAALGEERPRVVRAIDGLMPDAELEHLQAWAEAMLPLYDQGRLQAVLRPAGCLLERLAEEPDWQAALVYLRAPEGLGDDRLLMPLLERVAARADLQAFLTELIELWLAHDGLDPALVPSAEDDTLAALAGDLSRWLGARQEAAPDPRAGLARTLDFLLSEDDRLRADAEPPQWLLRTDPRGRAWPARDEAGGLAPPFADLDGDGLADLAPDGLTFLDARGEPLAPPPPFAADDQRPLAEGRLVWRYSELGATPLLALAEQLGPLVRAGLLWDLPRAAPALLGPRAACADDQGVFPGYRPDDAPLQALAHLGVVLADYDRLPELLEALVTLGERAEPALARLLRELDKVGQVVELYPEVGLRAHHRLLDDLMPLLQEAALHGHLAAALDSVGDARWGRLEAGLADLLRYRDRLTDADLRFREPTDWSQSDESYPHRSNLQRGVHLIHDTLGASYAARIDLFGWWTIPDMLVFYIDSAAGDSTGGLAEVDWAVRVAVSEFTSTTPPAEEVNRFMVHDHGVLGNPRGREGLELRAYNAEALLALEASGALDGLRPAWTAFALRDRATERGGTRVLAELMAAVHPHYSCRLPAASPACADLRPLEPMLLEVLDSAEPLSAAIELLAVARTLTTPRGEAVLVELTRFVEHLVRADPGLRRHDGATSVPGGDGLTPVYPMSRLHLALDALRFLDRVAEASPDARRALDRTLGEAHDRFLGLAEQPDGSWRFQNRRAWFLALDALAHLAERAGELRAEGRLSAELAALEASIREALSGRVLPRVVTAWGLVADHPTLPGRLDALALELVDEAQPARRRENRRLLAWALQHLQVTRVTAPFARALGRHLDPRAPGFRRVEAGDGGPATCQAVEHVEQAEDEDHQRLPRLRVLGRTLALLRDLLALGASGDGGPPRPVAAELVARALTRPPDNPDNPLGDVLEAVGRVHRREPARRDRLEAADLAEVLRQVADYLFDPARGLEKFYVLVERRDGFE
jgi:hypothetical protein